MDEREMILELAANIGKAVKESSFMKEYEAAEAAYIADEKLQKTIQEYTVQQQVLAEESAKPAPNAFLVEKQNKQAVTTLAIAHKILSFIKKFLCD